ncbi:MAG: class I SAM-dependent methyltransferase [Solobacterium sp.]|nr:class I SAM-dependent methyltransferase [Solobacterium sp.]MCH4222546.1 class I SAM-dependent methyltransferase [Solobacterium sp.]MCH4265478.1 class I SAM-dependent methyltransferase [Solobacterium sp.]
MAEVHYFTDNRDLPSNRRTHSWEFGGQSFSFVTDEGVFSKSEVDYGTGVLLKSAVKESLKGNLLDLGCGYGVIGIVLKTLYPSLNVTCSDVNPRAVELTELNSTENRAAVTALVSDRFVQIPGSFDVILTNPPIRAGKEIIYGMYQGAFEHLTPGGLFLAVVRRKQGAETSARKIEEIFGACEVIARDKGYWILKGIK